MRRLPVEPKPKVANTARDLIETLRAKRQQSGVEGLMREYHLSSQEGVALMGLAEALLRIPDAPTREALIRDKIGKEIGQLTWVATGLCS
jgi:RHH-type proline utilization regulon transcriptional repressor/proline dehydrogenase/delta 1-pyrroline-5-carboxylate dehydrogenase